MPTPDPTDVHPISPHFWEDPAYRDVQPHLYKMVINTSNLSESPDIDRILHQAFSVMEPTALNGIRALENARVINGWQGRARMSQDLPAEDETLILSAEREREGGL